MQLSDFLTTILSSNSTDWEVIADGPTYLYDPETWHTGSDQLLNIKIKTHHSIAIYRKDISISLAWGLEENDNFNEDYATRFADTSASTAWLDLFYNGSLIKRELYVVVDGGRAFLPIADRIVEKNTYKITGWTVNQDRHNLIKLLNEIRSNAYDFDSYFARSGIQIK